MKKMIVRLWVLVCMGVFALNLRAEATWTSSTCAPSGGGIWITATRRLKVAATVKLLAKGGDSAWFGNANGGGGRISFGVWLPDGEISTLAVSGELPEGSRTVVCGEKEFLADYPDVTISLEGGKANNHEDEPLEVCQGTFRYLVGIKPGIVLIVR